MKKITSILCNLVLLICITANAALPSPGVADRIHFDAVRANVSNILITEITSSEAVLSWTPDSTETNWQYVYSTMETADPNTLPTYQATGTPEGSLSGLDAGTTYYVWVRSDFGEDGFGIWVTTLFTTVCMPVLSLNENFDIPGANTIPNCWSKFVESTSGAAGVTYNTISSYSPDYSMRFLNGFDINAKIYLISPPSPNVGSGNYRVKFKYQSTSNNTAIVFGTMTDPTDITTFTQLGTFPATSVWQDAIVDLPAGSDTYFAFRQQVSSNLARTYLDNVIFEPTPPCPDILIINASNVTNLTATIDWLAGGSETAWQYALGDITDTDPEALPLIDISVNPTVSLESLTPNATYKLWVRSNCGGGIYGGWSVPEIFNTACNPVADITENFDTIPPDTLPECWSYLNATNTLNASVRVIDFSSFSAPNCLLLFSSNDNGGDQYLILPTVNTLDSGNHILKFKAKGFDGGELLQVGTMTGNTDASGFVESQAFTLTTEWATLSVVVSSANSNYIAMKHAGPSYANIYLDDIEWLPAPDTAPICADVTVTPDSHCGNQSSSFQWEAVDDASGYKLTIGTSTGATDILDALDLGNVLTYTYTGQAATTYYYTLVPYNLIGGNATDCVENSFETNQETCLCISQPPQVNEDGFISLTLGDTDYTLPETGAFSNQFQDVATLYLGINNPLDIHYNIGAYMYNFYLYVDLNNDYQLTDDEILFSALPPVAAMQTGSSFILPTGLAPGHRKARLIAGLYLSPPNPCYNEPLAETVDFIVDIVDPDCTPPSFDSAVIVPDCTTGQFFVDVNVTALGNNTPVLTDGTTLFAVDDIGMIHAGPFSNGAIVNLTLEHGANYICDVQLGTFTYLCPPDCDITEAILPGVQYNLNIPDGDGIWNVTACTANTPGKEKLYSFTPDYTGDYIMYVSNATGGMVDYLYKEAGGNCDENGWACIGSTPDSGIYPLSLTAGTAYLILADNEGTTSRTALVGIDLPLSTTEIEKETVKLYPNPVTDIMHISFKTEISAITVVNLLGQLVIMKPVNANEAKIDLRRLASGTYLVKIELPDGIQKTVKILKL